jgi:hypothetical protein
MNILAYFLQIGLSDLIPIFASTPPAIADKHGVHIFVEKCVNFPFPQPRLKIKEKSDTLLLERLIILLLLLRAQEV